jgi:hypothetical protein
MRGGNAYKNNERCFLAYRVCYYVLHQGYSASHECICLPDCMTHAIKREWSNPPGEECTGFIRRRRRRLHTVKLQIQPPRIHPTSAVARSNCHPREIKFENLPKEVIEIEDNE